MSIRDVFQNTWGKIIVTLLPFLVVGAAAIITMREKVAQLETTATQHVTRAEVNGQLEAILRELAALREDVRELRRSR